MLVVDLREGREIARMEKVLDESEPELAARRVAELGTAVLICGAISRPLEEMLEAAGVEVVSQTCGPAEDVLDAFLAGRLTGDAFAMPGCSRRRQRRQGRGRCRNESGTGKGRRWSGFQDVEHNGERG